MSENSECRKKQLDVIEQKLRDIEFEIESYSKDYPLAGRSSGQNMFVVRLRGVQNRLIEARRLLNFDETKCRMHSKIGEKND